MTNFGAYIHIPFCVKKCNYCDFCSTPATKEDVAAYFNALKQEILMCAEDVDDGEIKTVFFGGGTPSSVDSDYIAQVLETLQGSFNYSPTEITVECNPESVTREKMLAYRAAGVNRISIGVQSLNDKSLKVLGRIHDKNAAISAILTAKEYFENVSADIMLGIPLQTREDALANVDALLGLGITHLSAYGLSIEEGTPFYDMATHGDIFIDDDLAADIYSDIVGLLKARRFLHYEISNFARAGYECAHNLGYWRRTPYLGFGASAAAFYGKCRYVNTTSIDEYVSRINSGARPTATANRLTCADERAEAVMLALRLGEGLNIAAFNKAFNCDFEIEYAAAINKNKKNLIIENNTLYLKEDAYYISNGILADFI